MHFESCGLVRQPFEAPELYCAGSADNCLPLAWAAARYLSPRYQPYTAPPVQVRILYATAIDSLLGSMRVASSIFWVIMRFVVNHAMQP